MGSKDQDRQVPSASNIFGFIFVLRVPIDGTLYVTIYFDLPVQVKLKARNMKYTPTLFNCQNVYFG